MNNNQRINQLLMQTRGLSSTNLEGTALIERLRREAFALAAWSCREIDRITAALPARWRNGQAATRADAPRTEPHKTMPPDVAGTASRRSREHRTRLVGVVA